MSKIVPFSPVKLVIPTLTAATEFLPRIRSELETAFGPIDYESRLLPFNYTEYYESEMGPDLRRIFYSIGPLFGPEQLADIKLRTDAIEKTFSVDSRRKVNLDPGVLSLSRFILATTKDHAHRIPLKGGIYAEVTLMYHKNGFEPLPWTYPDYRTPEYGEILSVIRGIYRRQLSPTLSA
ncbi:MAG TPA: DUF4416 family protein [Spirochaetia bacterium]|nr:DUF4416 family protein [Spirochaetia bacterium]